MKLQSFQAKDRQVVGRFIRFRRKNPKLGQTLSFSWSNSGFGIDPFECSTARLTKYKAAFVELLGNRYSPDLEYKTRGTKKILDGKHDIAKVPIAELTR